MAVKTNKLTSNLLSVLGSYFLPGLGQAFEGRWFYAFAYMFGALTAYMMFAPLGMVIHICSIFDATIFAIRKRKLEDIGFSAYSEQN